MLFLIFIGFERKIEETSVKLGRFSEIYALVFKLEIKLYMGVQLETYILA